MKNVHYDQNKSNAFGGKRSMTTACINSSFLKSLFLPHLFLQLFLLNLEQFKGTRDGVLVFLHLQRELERGPSGSSPLLIQQGNAFGSSVCLEQASGRELLPVTCFIFLGLRCWTVFLYFELNLFCMFQLCLRKQLSSNISSFIYFSAYMF